MMEKEKNSQIEEGELSDDDLGSVAGGQSLTINGKKVTWSDAAEMDIIVENGVYTFNATYPDGRKKKVEVPETYFRS